MPTNIELKAAIENTSVIHGIASRLSSGPPEVIEQTDVFFGCEAGRLKLRMFPAGSGELIFYVRSNEPGARRSEYIISSTPDPEDLLRILEKVTAKTATVTKTRHLYRVGQTRVHIDEVEGLGSFLELEVVLEPGQTEDEGQSVAAALLKEFGIQDRQLVPFAYVDLLKRHH